ncbi:restriction endonuclease subunit S, partial [Vibrio parahaemolyticus]|nr:restriction endonuclease subunit S [Vibrio parahaemolyticus]
TTEESIDQLKQTILQLAVMGKLVPQDPSDEPAAELLKRIAEEKAQLVKEKKIKKQKALPPISEDEKPFELPNGWEWCRLGDLELSSEAGWSPKCLDTPRSEDNWGVLKVSAVTWNQYNPMENKELPNSLAPREHLEVQDGDFLISRANTADLVAKAVIVPNDSPTHLMMSDKIIRFRFS